MKLAGTFLRRELLKANTEGAGQWMTMIISGLSRLGAQADLHVEKPMRNVGESSALRLTDDPYRVRNHSNCTSDAVTI